MSKLPEIKLRLPYSLIIKVAKLMEIEIDFKKFEKNLNDFYEFFHKYRNKILIKISEKCGFDWEEKDIMIYTIPEQIKKFPSICYPLLLKLGEDHYFNLYLLTHELCHRFIEENEKLKELSFRKWKKTNKLIPEVIVEFLTVNIIAEILGEEKAQELHNKEKRTVKTRDMEKSYKLANEFREKFNPNLPSPKRFLVLLEKLKI